MPIYHATIEIIAVNIVDAVDFLKARGLADLCFDLRTYEGDGSDD